MNKVQRTLALLAGSTLVAGATYKTLVVPDVPTTTVVVNSTPVNAPAKTNGEYALTGLEIILGTIILLTVLLKVWRLWLAERTPSREDSQPTAETPLAEKNPTYPSSTHQD